MSFEPCDCTQDKLLRDVINEGFQKGSRYKLVLMISTSSISKTNSLELTLF